MKDQVLSIDKMQHLQSLGVDISKASMCWWIPTGDDIDSPDLHLRSANEEFINHIPTFTLQDILEILSKIQYETFVNPMFQFVYISNFDTWNPSFRSPTNFENQDLACHNPLDAAYQMLLWCIENKHIKTN